MGENEGCLGKRERRRSPENIISDSQSKYRSAFTTLRDSISNIATKMQNIELVYAKGSVSKFRIRREQAIEGQNKTITYYIYFVDRNGLWKIDAF